MQYAILIAPCAAVLALAFALFFARKVLKMPEAENTRGIAAIIRRGANAFLKRQYLVVAIFFGCMFVLLGILALVGFVGPFMPFAFVTGGIFSGLSGFLGMKIATAANARTATACQSSLNKGLRAAFSAGSVMGLVVVGLGLCDLSIWYFVLKGFYSVSETALTEAQFIATNMITFGMGASSMALFARVGGGIFTKAADVGADLVGKVEENIPEDDPRNPAVIADNVGDNVGDVAGMGADLYESYVGSILSAMALGVAAGLDFRGALLPLGIAAIGVLFSIIGTFFVRTKENVSQKGLLRALRAGTWFAAGGTAVASALFIWLVMPQGTSAADIFRLIAPVLIGLAAGVLIGFFTEFFTSASYSPTKKLAEASESGAGPVIINGTALGMLSTLVPVLIIAAAVLGAYFACGGMNNSEMGMFGIGISAVGMLSTLGITLSTDAYGPVADNAGGIAQMSGMNEEVRTRTDALDSLGNTTAATGKGFAIGSAMLTALALLSSFIAQVKLLEPNFQFDLAVDNPVVLVGVFVGAMLPFLFSALTMSAVGKSAQHVVLEVRRQFAKDPGILAGTSEPDYARCVTICTKSAQKQMILPAVIAVLSPILAGTFLGVNGVTGLLLGSTVTGFLLAVFMSNSGVAWDNAKKYVEDGNFGGKGSPAHKAAVIGDTVGDPFKDTSGPSINILIKLISVVAIVFAQVILAIGIL
ncbi:MAG TPA: sodium-translocating pyrophosphatase [Candidatus Borkfalkia faecavium]|uniref:Putative K(+)-stimulated pyrophosphate-energized sodium pump n=1 Tax=Candidatus Borkfalkia faecavium TaxID=2838508 RepID=A0A9D1W145_9FIRM|nr:sodium-translocating pyrophosphatase [Candidatus Borkfalkia faecavium]